MPCHCPGAKRSARLTRRATAKATRLAVKGKKVPPKKAPAKRVPPKKAKPCHCT